VIREKNTALAGMEAISAHTVAMKRSARNGSQSAER
jgi:hypothetical protein